MLPRVRDGVVFVPPSPDRAGSSNPHLSRFVVKALREEYEEEFNLMRRQLLAQAQDLPGAGVISDNLEAKSERDGPMEFGADC